jgi:hypothetical protein
MPLRKSKLGASLLSLSLGCTALGIINEITITNRTNEKLYALPVANLPESGTQPAGRPLLIKAHNTEKMRLPIRKNNQLDTDPFLAISKSPGLSYVYTSSVKANVPASPLIRWKDLSTGLFTIQPDPQAKVGYKVILTRESQY